MINITEQDIHLYILNKSLLNKNIIEEIEKRIQIDDNFISEVNEIKEFYSIYESLETFDYKYSFILKPKFINEGTNHLKLAAQQNDRTDNKLKFINTYAEADKLIMVRLLYNPAEKEYDLYVLCEDDVTMVSYAMIKIEGWEKEFIADKNGKVRIKTDFLDDRGSIKVTLPIAKYKMNAEQFTFEEISPKLTSKNADYETTLYFEGKTENVECLIEFINKEPSTKLKAILIDSEDVENPEIVDIVNNKFSFRKKETGTIDILIINDF